ncbi:MAG: hypothetical protein ACI81L_000803 [Verrucomicrobiales bacterium]|jgi:hypothetical protein
MRSTEDILLEGIRAGQFGGKSKPHGDHAMGFVAFLDDPTETFIGHVVDLGSGAGLPALILAEAFPLTTWSLVERRSGRTELLSRAIQRLEMTDRVTIVDADAALAGRSALRATADWVTARSFGPPSDTAECAAPFLREGGQLLTSEPFGTNVDDRWPTRGLLRVGMAFDAEWTTPSGRYVRMHRSGEAIDDIPRPGARKKPLF